MLNYKAFQEGLDTITATYVNKRFNLDENQLKQWYRLLKGLTDDTYILAIDEWCANRNTLPAPSDIIEGANRHKTSEFTAIPKNKTRCHICEDSGFVKVNIFNSEMNMPYEYLECCICEAGEYCHSNYPYPQLSRDKATLLENEKIIGKPKLTDKFYEQFSMEGV